MSAPPVPQPLAGLRVVEFTHMVMGPTCGMMLADMGAEVIKVEPVDGEGTRRLLGRARRDRDERKDADEGLLHATGIRAARRDLQVTSFGKP